MALDQPDLIAVTARDAGLVACRRCTRVWPIEATTCARCGSRLVSRDPKSLSRVWAWWALGIMAYIPANLWPMLETRTLWSSQDDTIVSGALELLLHGSAGIAVVILVASVGIPLAKFFAIGCAVSLVKIADLAQVSLGPAFWMFAGLVVVTVAQDALVDRWSVWRSISRT